MDIKKDMGAEHKRILSRKATSKVIYRALLYMAVFESVNQI